MSEDQNKQPTATDLMSQADAKITSLRSENERMEKNIAELKELEARKIMGGQTRAGQTGNVQSEESPKDYAKRVLEGKV